MSQLRATIAGAVTMDRTRGPDGQEGWQPGGSVFYGARALRALGADVTAITAMHPSSAAAALGGAFGDIRVSMRAAPWTAAFENRYDASERVSQILHAPAPSIAPQVPYDTELLVLAPVMQELDLGRWCAAAPQGAYVSLGAQGVLRGVSGRTGPVAPVSWDPPESVVERLDAVFLSEEDVRHLPGLVPWLRQALPLLVVTHGARGATAFAGDRILHVPARRVQVVDPTGAGDTFHAVAAARLAAGRPLKVALDDATRAAARCVSRRAPALLRARPAEPARTSEIPLRSTGLWG